jgi:hypothetical protein
LTVTGTATDRSNARRTASSVRAEPKPRAMDDRSRDSRVIRTALRDLRAVSFCGTTLRSGADAPFICG